MIGRIFRRGRSQAESPADTAIYDGRFLYAGGHPERAEPGHKFSRPKVYVYQDRIEYQERVKNTHQTVLTIARDAIAGVEHTQTAPRMYDNPDQFITISVRRGERTFAVRFKAEGVTAQKDAFAFYGAVNSMLAGEAS